METPEPPPVEPDVARGEPRYCEYCGKRLIKTRKSLKRPAKYNRFSGRKIIMYLACYTCPDWIPEIVMSSLGRHSGELLTRHSRFVFYKSRPEGIWERV